jgi:hypothetical protein
MVEAFAAEPGELEEPEVAEAQRLRTHKYLDPAWHAGPWSELTPPAVRALLSARSAEQPC